MSHIERTIPIPLALASDPAAPAPAPASAARRAAVAAWLWTGAALTFLILVVGGITRLTQSGLSMVDWQPIVGVVPPLTEAQWLETFERYRQFPEYQQLRQGMTLGEFKFIFFWEYLHRLIARTIGLVFLVPFAVFAVRRYFDAKLLRRALVLFALGGLQGFLGWYMVSSGLVDRPHVSHYRLAIHLSAAFAIFGCCVWFALDLGRRATVTVDGAARRTLRRGLLAVGALLGLQILWGALVAGLDAGLYSNTFPKMSGQWVPPFAFGLDPLLINLVENPVTVQWVHRVLGTALALAILAFAYAFARHAPADPRGRRLNRLLWAGIATQYLLGVLTVVLHVPVSVAAAHQAVAMLLFGVWLALLHRIGEWSEGSTVM